MSINIHPATVHFPIAFLLLASGAGLLYLYWRPLAVLHTLMWWPMRLGWLATLPADEVRIEPVGLAAVYEQFHSPDSAPADSTT
mgnify:CR=1 FL=1